MSASSTTVVSERKLAANRRNAQRSTGPRSDEGKSKSSQNAITHGLTSCASVLPGEDSVEFEHFAVRLRAELRPAGEMQRFVVDRVIHLAWKLRRVARVEQVVVERARDPRNRTGWERLHRPDLSGADVIARHLGCPDGGTIGRLTIYEQRIERSLHAAMRELRKLREEQSEELEQIPNDGTAQVMDPAVHSAVVGEHSTEAVHVGAILVSPASGQAEPDRRARQASPLQNSDVRRDVCKNEPTATDITLCGHVSRAVIASSAAVEATPAPPTIARDSAAPGHAATR